MPDTDPLERILSRLDDMDRRLIRIETKVCRALEGAGYDPTTGQRAPEGGVAARPTTPEGGVAARPARPVRQMAALTHAQRDAARK